MCIIPFAYYLWGDEIAGFVNLKPREFVMAVLGSFILGALVETFALFWSPSQELRALIVVGLLGAFTTFSTFSMDVVALFNKGEMLHAALYIGASVALSVFAFCVEMQLMRAVLS